jgi:hypothetical protein
METPSIRVLRGGQWVETDDVFVYDPKQPKKPKGVLLAYYVGKPVVGADPKSRFKVLLNKYQEPPTNLTNLSGPVGGKVTIGWTAPPSAAQYTTYYQVTKQTLGAQDVVTTTETLPAGGVWTQATSMEVAALAADTTYLFTVKAQRTGNDGKPITSATSSNKLKLFMGRPAIPVKSPHYDNPPGTSKVDHTELLLLPATRSDTWTHDRIWAFSAGSVIQGYASNSGLNGWGCVSYEKAFTRLSPAVQAISPQAPGADTMRHLEVVKVVIDRVLRNTSGAGTPVVEAHAWKANWANSSSHPVVSTAYGVFTAPAESKAKDDFDLTVPGSSASRLLEWGREWIKEAPAHNGICVYDTGRGGSAASGFNGFCAFYRANYTAADWRLKLYVRWSWSVAAVDPVWTKSAPDPVHTVVI